MRKVISVGSLCTRDNSYFSTTSNGWQYIFQCGAPFMVFFGERRDRDGENNRKTFIDLSWSLNTCECTLSTGMPSFPVMRGRRARAVSGERVYAACAHAVPRLARGARHRATCEAVASPPLSFKSPRGRRCSSNNNQSKLIDLIRPRIPSRAMQAMAASGPSPRTPAVSLPFLVHDVGPGYSEPQAQYSISSQ